MAGQLPGDCSYTESARNSTGTHIQDDTPQPFMRKWFFRKEEIEYHSPSRKDGITFEEESHLRKLYCSYLQELGMEFKLPQLTIATATVLCHQFYMRQSHAKNHWQAIATSSMFLACKAEDTPRWLSDFVLVGYKLMYKWDPAAPHRIRQKEIFDKQKDIILLGERLLLATVAFDLNIEHPYKPLVAAVKKLDISHKELLKVAWNFVNDWLRTTLCLEYKPHYIAAGSLFLAAKLQKVKLPAKGNAWWMQFDVSPKQLEEVIQRMQKLLAENQKQVAQPNGCRSTVSKSIDGKTDSPESCITGGSAQDSRNTARLEAGGGSAQDSRNTAGLEAGGGSAQDSRNTARLEAGGDYRYAVSTCSQRKRFRDINDNTKETENCQTRDSGSANTARLEAGGGSAQDSRNTARLEAGGGSAQDSRNMARLEAGGGSAQDSRNTEILEAGGDYRYAVSTCSQRKRFRDINDNTKETENCQTSDSGSANTARLEAGGGSAQDSRNTARLEAGGDYRYAVSTCSQRKRFRDINDNTKETENCQTSDSGSANSVVEDGDLEPKVADSDPNPGCKIVSLEASYCKIDVHGIRERIKKRKLDRHSEIKLGGAMDDDIDSEGWIEKELESGIEKSSARPDKLQKS